MPDEVTLELGLDESQEPSALRRHVARALGRAPDSLPELAVLKRSIDARRGRVRFHVVVGPASALPASNPPPPVGTSSTSSGPTSSNSSRAAVPCPAITAA